MTGTSSLRRIFADIPVRWRMVYGEADRTPCVDDIEPTEIDVQPKCLREKLAESQVLAI
jgi:uncharacterized protein YbdZ (MbtH family)